MLAHMLSSPVNRLKLGSRDHAALLAGEQDVCAAVFARDGHACHVCGSRCHGAMQIDHLGGHKKSEASKLATICAFCHDLTHPLWSGARKRIVPILAPDISQVDLTRLAWVLLAWRGSEDAPIDTDAVVEMVEERRAAFRAKFHCGSSEALFEAAIGVASASQLGRPGALQVLERIDQSLRFWPAELTPEYEDLDPASRLSVWRMGGFRVIADEVAELIRKDQKPDFDRIMDAMKVVLS